MIFALTVPLNYSKHSEMTESNDTMTEPTPPPPMSAEKQFREAISHLPLELQRLQLAAVGLSLTPGADDE
jgi:hypothetical protein